MPGNLAEELENAKNRRKSRYWTYDAVARSNVGFSTNDLGSKWGHGNGDPDEPRQTRSGRTRREPVPDSGALNRRIADLHRHFTRNVEEFIVPDKQTIPGEYPTNSPWREATTTTPDESRLTTPAPEISTRDISVDVSHLSKELVDEEWCSSGQLAHDTLRLSNELAPRDSSRGLVPDGSPDYARLDCAGDLSTENKPGVELEGGSLVLHPNFSRLL
jgi:hypothetical protein